MSQDSSLHIPTIILLLDRVRRVRADEAARVVTSVMGPTAAASLTAINEDPHGMEYIEWRDGETIHHIGTSPQPYITVSGEGKEDPATGNIELTRWTMREEVPPDDPTMCDAWMRHTAWMYVDALRMEPTDEARDVARRNVLRVASHFVDARCVLLWRRGSNDKRVALPTPHAIATMQAGEWPA
jgi:hypothetical protein